MLLLLLYSYKKKNKRLLLCEDCLLAVLVFLFGRHLLLEL